MPILGMDVPARLVDATRDALAKALNQSALLKGYFPETEFVIRRKVYTGDYKIEIHPKGSSVFEPLAQFGMLPLPGCRAICVLHHSEVHPACRGRGIGKELLRIRMQVAKEVGYTTVVATVQGSNTIERKLLEEADWSLTDMFMNRTTEHAVCVYRKLL